MFKVEFIFRTDAQIVFETFLNSKIISDVHFDISLITTNQVGLTVDISSEISELSPLAVDHVGGSKDPLVIDLTSPNLTQEIDLTREKDPFVIDLTGDDDHMYITQNVKQATKKQKKVKLYGGKTPKNQKRRHSDSDDETSKPRTKKKKINDQLNSPPKLSQKQIKKRKMLRQRQKAKVKYTWKISPKFPLTDVNVTQKSTIIVLCDGSGNTGEGGSGTFISLSQPGLVDSFIKLGIQIPSPSNSYMNEALHYISDLPPEFNQVNEIIIQSDNRGVITNLFTKPKCLLALKGQKLLKKLVERFSHTKFLVGWIPREDNEVADGLAGRARKGNFEDFDNRGVVTAKMRDLFSYVREVRSEIDSRVGCIRPVGRISSLDSATANNLSDLLGWENCGESKVNDSLDFGSDHQKSRNEKIQIIKRGREGTKNDGKNLHHDKKSRVEKMQIIERYIEVDENDGTNLHHENDFNDYTSSPRRFQRIIDSRIHRRREIPPADSGFIWFEDDVEQEDCSIGNAVLVHCDDDEVVKFVEMGKVVSKRLDEEFIVVDSEDEEIGSLSARNNRKVILVDSDLSDSEEYELEDGDVI